MWQVRRAGKHKWKTRNIIWSKLPDKLWRAFNLSKFQRQRKHLREPVWQRWKYALVLSVQLHHAWNSSHFVTQDVLLRGKYSYDKFEGLLEPSTSRTLSKRIVSHYRLKKNDRPQRQPRYDLLWIENLRRRYWKFLLDHPWVFSCPTFPLAPFFQKGKEPSRGGFLCEASSPFLLLERVLRSTCGVQSFLEQRISWALDHLPYLDLLLQDWFRDLHSKALEYNL